GRHRPDAGWQARRRRGPEGRHRVLRFRGVAPRHGAIPGRGRRRFHHLKDGWGVRVEPIWKKHWPPSIDEASLRIPGETLPEALARNARRVPDRPAIVFYGREVSFAELDSAA